MAFFTQIRRGFAIAGSQTTRRSTLGLGVSATALVACAVPNAAWAQDDASQAPSAAEADAIVVTGRRAAIQSADDRKKNAISIVDSVVADDAGKLPDNSITEVLQRVPGVTIVRFQSLNDPDHFSAEGSGIQLRGLSGVASRLNGRDIFSANGGRSLQFSDVTPELMQAVDVYKSSTADQIEGGTGGSVDLRTKLPFDYSYGLHFAGSSDISMGDLSQKTDYSASGLVAGKFNTGIGDIGFVFDYAHSQLSTKSQFVRMEEFYRTNIQGTDYFIPGGYTYGEENYQRKRDGIYGAIQWAPTSDLTLTGVYFQSKYSNTDTEYGSFVTSQSLAVDPSQSVFDDNGGLISSPAVFQRDPVTGLASGAPISSGGTSAFWEGKNKTEDISGSLHWTPASLPITFDASYQHTKSTASVDRISVFRTVDFPNSYGLDLSGSLPQISVPAGTQAALLDPTNYAWQAVMPHNNDNSGKMDSVQGDLTWDVGEGFFKSVKVGGRWSKRTERDLDNGYAWSALGFGSFADGRASDYEAHAFKDFFRGDVQLPGTQLFPSQDFIQNTSVQGFFDLYGGSPGRTPGFILPGDQTDYTTKNLAGYAMVNFGTNWGESSLTGNAGVRVVNIKNASTGYFQQTSTQFERNGQIYTLANTAEIRDDGAEYTRVLPAVNLTYTPISTLQIRAAYNITMDNASFYDLRASGTLGVNTLSGSGGNGVPNTFANYTTTSGDPTLKPTMSNNFDLSVEWYPKPGTTLHVAGFYKSIKDLVVFGAAQRNITVQFADGTSEQALATTNDAHTSDETATVKGVEIGGRTFFDQLPGWLAGIGVEANYTFIDSKNPGDLYFDIDGVKRNDVPLKGLSKHNLNAAFLYEKDPFSLRIAYSWRSKYLQSTTASGTNNTYTYYDANGVGTSVPTNLPVYGASYGTLDAGLTLRVNEHLNVQLQAQNILNATQKTLMGGNPGGTLYGRSWFQSDRRYRMGVNVTF
ncbi:TonB-dependent receptor [Novosphingobium sp. BL-8A]|uniref:TonB-dependent receptor n=1 Tax=Novosphingobium sp. BL-8A TaxID=3127639 RepID=UPI0037567AB9